MKRSRRHLTASAAAVLLGCAIGVPAGLAITSTTSASDEPDAVENAAAEGEDATTDDASAFDELRDHHRVGLAHIASAMREWGDEADAGRLARLEDEIERLGGVSAEEQAKIDRKIDNTITDEEYDAYLRANLSPEDYERVKAGLRPLDHPADPERPEP